MAMNLRTVSILLIIGVSALVPELAAAKCDAVTRALQIEFTNRGYSPGGIDGCFGASTSAALRAFQKSNSLTLTRKPNFKTLQALYTPGNATDSSSDLLGVGFAIQFLWEWNKTESERRSGGVPIKNPDGKPWVIVIGSMGGEGTRSIPDGFEFTVKDNNGDVAAVICIEKGTFLLVSSNSDVDVSEGAIVRVNDNRYTLTSNDWVKKR